ncbi:alpha/beta hydrolase [Myxococcota bacterium]|nr:alpha/beta hydrolase [Myxococcota bacterium]
MAERPSETVFVVHGFLRTGASCAGLALGLRRRGFRVVNRTYFNYVRELQELAAAVRAAVERELGSPSPPERIHFVTHSMGGLVVRRLLEDGLPERLGRVVSIAAPHQGADLAVWWRARLAMPWGRWDPLMKLTPDGVKALAPRLPEGVEWGVIAGGTGGERGRRRVLAGDNDGKVRVAEAEIEGARERLLVPFGHTLIMNRGRVVEQVARFLREGRFDPRGAGALDWPRTISRGAG